MPRPRLRQPCMSVRKLGHIVFASAEEGRPNAELGEQQQIRM